MSTCLADARSPGPQDSPQTHPGFGIGIGERVTALACHTTVQAGPHRAFREVEVNRVEGFPTDQPSLDRALRSVSAHSYGCKSCHKLVTASEVKRNCMRATAGRTNTKGVRRTDALRLSPPRPVFYTGCGTFSSSSSIPYLRSRLGRLCENAERGITVSHPASTAFIFRSPCR